MFLMQSGLCSPVGIGQKLEKKTGSEFQLGRMYGMLFVWNLDLCQGLGLIRAVQVFWTYLVWLMNTLDSSNSCVLKGLELNKHKC